MNLADQTAALDALARRVINPYIVMTVILFLLGIVIRLSGLPELEMEPDEAANGDKIETKKSILGYPHLILGAIALFFYVGVEVIAGDTIIRYGLSLGIEMDTAKAFTTYTMATMVLGYVLGIVLIPKIISQQFALQVSASLGILICNWSHFYIRPHFCSFRCLVWTFKRYSLACDLAVGAS